VKPFFRKRFPPIQSKDDKGLPQPKQELVPIMENVLHEKPKEPEFNCGMCPHWHKITNVDDGTDIVNKQNIRVGRCKASLPRAVVVNNNLEPFPWITETDACSPGKKEYLQRKMVTYTAGKINPDGTAEAVPVKGQKVYDEF
jgi:hypothetical protein